MKSVLWTASLVLATLSLAAAARAVTSVTIDGNSSPVTLTEGEKATLRFDVSQPGGPADLFFVRDLAGTGGFDPADPAQSDSGIVDGDVSDLDPAPGKVAFAITVAPGWPAGPYVAHVQDASDGSTADLPLTIVPAPQRQAISGRVGMLSGGGSIGAPPADAIIWAYRDAQTPAASADMRKDGSYTLPLPPGTYLVFAEWFGSLRSQRQVVTVTAGQPVTNINLPLLHGQEVDGTLKDDQGKPMANAPVQATPTGSAAAGAMPFTTQTFADGSYLLVLPDGQYTITARGSSRTVTVADEALDGIDFPPAALGPAPAVGTIVTVAGNGSTGLGGDGGAALNARLDSPFAVAVDKAGNLYVADIADERIRKVDASGLISTAAGSGSIDSIRGLFSLNVGGFSGDGGPATAAQLDGPQHLAVDAAGNLYISDLHNNRVREVDAATGYITTVAGNGSNSAGTDSSDGDGGPATAAALRPQGVALDAAGNLYIADNPNHRVRKVGLDGIITTIAGGGTDPVTDGAPATGVALARPNAMAVDLMGNVFFSEGPLGLVLKVSPSSTISRAAGTGTPGYSGDGGPATAAQISTPGWNLAVDSAGSVYVADTDNNRVRKISPDGIITTVAGNGQSGFAGDGGPATAAQLDGPSGVAIDAAGNLYIADNGNSRVREVIGIAAPGVIGGR